jgi:hypothetical protein
MYGTGSGAYHRWPGLMRIVSAYPVAAYVAQYQTGWLQLRTVSGRNYLERTIKILFGRATWCAYLGAARS